MLQSFSSQHALCHFVNLNRISRTDKRASMQLGASASLSHSSSITFLLTFCRVEGGTGPVYHHPRAIAFVFALAAKRHWVQFRLSLLYSQMAGTQTKGDTHRTHNTHSDIHECECEYIYRAYIMSIFCRFLYFFASFALPACPSYIATVNNKRSKLAALTTPLPTPPQHPPAPVHLLQGLQ